jgi:hypothetical protein
MVQRIEGQELDEERGSDTMKKLIGWGVLGCAAYGGYKLVTKYVLKK